MLQVVILFRRSPVTWTELRHRAAKYTFRLRLRCDRIRAPSIGNLILFEEVDTLLIILDEHEYEQIVNSFYKPAYRFALGRSRSWRESCPRRKASDWR